MEAEQIPQKDSASNQSLEARQQSQSSQTASLQHTVQAQLIVVGGLVLVFAAYVLTARTRRMPSWQAQPIKNAS